MATALRVLLVEDREDDAQMLLHELRRGGYAPTWTRVDTRPAMAQALAGDGWDLVLSDHALAKFSGLDALTLVQERGLDVPVIIVSGEFDEEMAVAVLKAGARDYVTWDRLARLLPTVERELRQAANRRAQARIEHALRDSEIRFESAFRHAPIGMAVVGLDGRPLQANQALCDMLGYTEDELRQRSANDVTPAEDHEREERLLRRLAAGDIPTMQLEKRYIHKLGHMVWGFLSVSLVRDPTGTPLYGIAQVADITERRRAEEEKVALLEMARDIAGPLQLDEILDRVHRRTAALLSCDRIATYYWDPQRRAYCLVGQRGIPEEFLAEATVLSFAPGNPAVDYLASGQTVLINDIAVQPWFVVDLLARYGISTLVAAPLIVRGAMKGGIVALRPAPRRAFTAEQVELLEGVAGQIAIAIDAAEARRAEAEEARVSSALARAGQALISHLDQRVLLDRLCRLTREVLECDDSHTFLFDPKERIYSAAAGYGDTPDQWETLCALKIPSGTAEKLFQEADRDGVAQIFAPELNDPVSARLAVAHGVTVALCIPLRRGDQIVGVQTAAYRGRTEPFSPLQLRIGRGIGQLASLALTNAWLMQEMEQANRLKSDFVATMSHELRTPLNVIMGYNDLVLDGAYGQLQQEQYDPLQRVNRSARELLDLINATLDISRLEAGQVPIDRQPVDPRRLLGEIEHEIRSAHTKANVRLEWTVHPDLPELHTDAGKLKVVVKNLLANAQKFTAEGEVTLVAAAREGGLEITVSDTGIGIDAETLPIIFEAFRQADSSTTRRYGGVGLGLYIVRRLLELLGGTVAVESTVGRGSTFRVWVPGS